MANLSNLPFGTSKNTINASVTINAPETSDGGELSATASFSYRSRWFGQYEVPLLAVPIPAYSLYNVTMDWRNIGGTRASAQLYVKNLFDRDYVAGALSSLNSSGYSILFPGEPRTYGLRLSFAFGS